MIDPELLVKLRYRMSSPPSLGGNPGQYEERWTQWFLEQSFFREFVYRNPERKKGKELADAVVLFDDVLLMAQVKAQRSPRDAVDWAKKNLPLAVRQLQGTQRALANSLVSKLNNELYGDVSFEASKYPHHIGLVILAHRCTPFAAEELAPDIRLSDFPIHVFSLSDFCQLVRRFDTAADMITFLEFRRDIGQSVKYLVHDEATNIKHMLPHIEQVLKANGPSTPPDVIVRTAQSFRDKALGRVLSSVDWRFGLAIDDMIARSHDLDPELPWNPENKQASGKVAEFLGWLSRDRRIKLGKRIVKACEGARDGQDHYFPYFHPSSGRVAVFLATSASRKERVDRIKLLLRAAQVRYGAKVGLGVATEPIGDGRSYDFAFVSGHPPPKVAEELRSLNCLFGEEEKL